MSTDAELFGKCFFDKRCTFSLILAFMLVLSAALSPLSAQPLLTLTTPDITSSYFHDENYEGLADKVMKEALSRVGFDLKVVVLPAERSLLMAKSGGVDGELLRTRGIEPNYPDLIRVAEPVADVEFVVFSLQPDNQIKDWASLKDKTIAVVTGMKIIEKNIPEGSHVSKVRNTSQLFAMVKNGRVEYAAFVRDIGESFLKVNGIKGVFASHSALSSVPTYTYLNEKYRDLAPKIAQSLREMKSDGTFQKILMNHQH
ncbi:MAG: transporter substrate-binding domain-containing protein [Pseudomonadales bacterium]|nr:transporter substrate-binding domain-containing protein [Pseudomonadales bacterium]